MNANRLYLPYSRKFSRADIFSMIKFICQKKIVDLQLGTVSIKEHLAS